MHLVRSERRCWRADLYAGGFEQSGHSRSAFAVAHCQMQRRLQKTRDIPMSQQESKMQGRELQDSWEDRGSFHLSVLQPGVRADPSRKRRPAMSAQESISSV